MKPRWALNKRYLSSPHREYLDYDYLHKLSADELDWLERFTDESLQGHFKNDGNDLHSGQARLDCYTSALARRRDLQNVVRACGLLESFEERCQNPDGWEYLPIADRHSSSFDTEVLVGDLVDLHMHSPSGIKTCPSTPRRCLVKPRRGVTCRGVAGKNRKPQRG